MQSILAACTVCPQWTYIPACSCSAYTSLVNKKSTLAFVVVDFSLLLVLAIEVFSCKSSSYVAQAKLNIEAYINH